MILNIAPGFSVTRGNNFKLAKQTCSIEVRKYFYCNRIVDAWNSLPNAVFAPSSAKNCKMNLCATRYGGRPQPRRRCVRRVPSSHYTRGTAPPVFGPYLLWPKGWMDEDATWDGSRLSSPRDQGTAGPCPCLLWPRRPSQLLLSSCNFI